MYVSHNYPSSINTECDLADLTFEPRIFILVHGMLSCTNGQTTN